MISVDDLKVMAGRTPLVQSVSFKFSPGMIVAVVGPNGAGKSTLLKCLSGEITHYSGRITVAGRSLDSIHHGDVARWRGVLPQSGQIPFNFTVREIVALGRSPHVIGRESRRDAEIVSSAMETTDCSHLADRAVQTLSGGELQRVHMARVLAQVWEPEPVIGRLLLLDEPTSALDLKHQYSLLHLVRRWADDGSAVLIVLHDINLAAQFADAFLWMKNGRAVSFGPSTTTMTPERIEEVFEVKATCSISSSNLPTMQVVVPRTST